jgi:hypothetical protein
MTKNIHKEIKFKSNLGFGTVSADGPELVEKVSLKQLILRR